MRRIKELEKQIAAMTIFVLLSALIATAVAFMGHYMRQQDSIRKYLENSTSVCRVPDIDRGFIPQGLSYHADSDSILLTGYMSNGNNSPVYIISRKNGQAKKISLRTPQGNAFKGHAGGVSLYNDFVYIAGSTEGCMYGLALNDLLQAEDGVSRNADFIVALKNEADQIRVSFTAADREFLYAGEFHRAPLFYTHASHTVMTPDGKQKAYLLGFVPDAEESAVPSCVYSIPDNIQGACFDDKFIYLSQTDGVFSARILTYAREELTTDATKEVLGIDVPLYYLTENSAHKITQVAPMAEEILIVDDKLYILFESASNRYRFGKKLGLDYILSTPCSFFH